MTPLALLTGSDLAAIVGSVLVLGGVIVTGFVALKSAGNSTAVVLVGTLNERLTKVENDHAETRAELTEVKAELSKSNRVTTAAVRFVEKLADRLRGAGIPVPQAPDELNEYLDPDMWGDHHAPTHTTTPRN